MYILGLNAFHWDSSACILKDGVLIAAAEEERFTRIKHWLGLPTQAVKFCLSAAGISLADVDYVTIGHDPKAKAFQKLAYVLRNPKAFALARERAKRTFNIANIIDDIAEELKEPLTGKRPVLKLIEHHRAHLASAFFASGFQEAAVISVDGFGDFTSMMRATGKSNRLSIMDSVSFPHSIGMFYTAMTQFLGFNNVGDEYKVMGLAPYGKPVHIDKISKVLKMRPSGKFELDLKYFSHHLTGVAMRMENNQPVFGTVYSAALVKEFGPVRPQGSPLTEYHKDIAASVQAYTEQVLFHVASHMRKVTGLSSLCVAGGVAQNSVANGKLASATGFRDIYIPSAGHDAGIAMGSALFLYNHMLRQPRTGPIYSAYTGSSFTNDEIETVLNHASVPFERLRDDEIFEIVTEALINKGVIGWFNGRAEFGPRALGARSIIADPRNPNAKDLLNEKIKRRESFRPFAPSILREYVKEYFQFEDNVPFMEKVFPIRPERRAEIPAVTHVDGTGRLQTVDKSVSPRYYKLIETFHKKTGVPILLNTSFNENEPIVNTPLEALDCFLRTKMDMLVMENCVVRRSKIE
jgi:carbamoyltransferase